MPYDIIIGRTNSDKQKFGKRGLLYLGKGYVKMGTHNSLSNNIWLDVARTHVILVAGKRGCLTEDTLVFTDKGYKPIIEFNEKKDKILSFNKERKEFGWEKAELLRYPLKNEEILEIELEDGRKINITKEHPLLVNYGKYIFWRSGLDLKEKDKIVLPTRLPEIKKDEESLRIARLLGYILSDGTMHVQKGIFKDGRGYLYNGTKARIRIFNNCNEVLEQAKEDFEKEFSIIAKRYKRNDCNCEVIETKQQKVVNKFSSLGVPVGLKSHIIRVPKIVFSSSNEFKKEFISALFDCDGYIESTGKTIDYASKSRKFLEDLQILLTHFGIESVIRIKNAKFKGKIYENYRLYITDNTSIENFKKIGFKNKYKQGRLDKHKIYSTRRRKTHYISEELVCTRIKNIKKIKGITEVYDLSVPKNHSFIANGIISHNSGKSYTLGTITEEISNLEGEEAKNIAPIIFDTMGIFWTMKYENDKEKSLLSDWNLKPKSLPVEVFVPQGKFEIYKEKNLPVDKTFSLKPSQLEAEDWLSVFNIQIISPEGVLLQKAISRLKDKTSNYVIKDIQHEISSTHDSSSETKQVVNGLFEAAKTWGIFSETEEGTEIKDLINPGKTTVIDISVYSSTSTFNVRALVISLISKKLFQERMDSRKIEEISSIQAGEHYLSVQGKKKSPLVWLFIDEAHEFLPKEGKTPATDALVQILREGRQPGISLVLATQQPGQIHKDVMTQSDIVISHRLTAAPDIAALNEIMQSYLLESISKSMATLPQEKGSALILDDNSERIYPIRVRPRFTWHGGEAPTSIKADFNI